MGRLPPPPPGRPANHAKLVATSSFACPFAARSAAVQGTGKPGLKPAAWRNLSPGMDLLDPGRFHARSRPWPDRRREGRLPQRIPAHFKSRSCADQRPNCRLLPVRHSIRLESAPGNQISETARCGLCLPRQESRRMPEYDKKRADRRVSRRCVTASAPKDSKIWARRPLERGSAKHIGLDPACF